MDMPTPEQMRARFAQLTAEREEKLAVSTPLREQRDEIARTSAAEIADLDASIGDAEAGLFDIDQERALIARALGGRTGEQGEG